MRKSERLGRVCTHPGCTVFLPWRAERRGTMCRPHTNAAIAAAPDRNAKMSKTMRDKWSEPGEREKRAASMSKAVRKRLAEDPVLREKFVERARQLGYIHGGSVAGTPGRKRTAQINSNRRLAHIPLEYRPDYLDLMRKKLSACERARIIGEQVAHDIDRFLKTGQLQRNK